MAEDEEKAKKEGKGPGFFKKAYVTGSNVTGTAINAVTDTLFAKRWRKYRTVEGRVPHVMKRLTRGHNYIHLLRDRLKELRDIEQKTDDQNAIRKQIEECYMHIGLYNMDVHDKEVDLFTHGHIDGKEGLLRDGKDEFTKGEKLMYKTEKIGIERDEFGKLEFDFPIPQEFKLFYQGGFEEEVSAFGSDNISKWQKAYDKVVDDMCRGVKQGMMAYLERKIKDKGELKKMEENLNENINEIIGGAAKIVLDEVIRVDIKEANDGFRVYLKEGSGCVDEYFKKLKTLKTQMMGFIPQKVRHKHTYYIIKRLTETERSRLMKYISPRTKIGETTVGLDENMKQLEVAGPGGYRYKRKHYPEGTVLIDIWDANDETDFEQNKITEAEIRQVPKDYITEVDLLEMAAYIHNDWDEYRDDLRDARYHPHTMLAIDYAMAINSDIRPEWRKGVITRTVKKGMKTISEKPEIEEKMKEWGINPVREGEWDSRREIFRGLFPEKWRKYDMVLGDGTVLKDQVRRASDLSPAFDKRAWKIAGKKWEFIGKRYYYDSPTITRKYYKWDQKDPILTTRGLSHHIIQKVIRETKYFKEAHEALLKISKQTGGYDYGPRRFNTDFHTDPFNIDLTKVNEQLPDPNEDYKKGVDRIGE